MSNSAGQQTALAHQGNYVLKKITNKVDPSKEYPETSVYYYCNDGHSW